MLCAQLYVLDMHMHGHDVFIAWSNVETEFPEIAPT